MMEARRHNSHEDISSQQVVQKLRVLDLLVGSSVKPIAQWSAQQKSDMVKLMRGCVSVVTSRASYADEATFNVEMMQTLPVQLALCEECDRNPDMDAHFA